MVALANPIQDATASSGIPLVSVVTVSLNAADTIQDTIASVALQSVDFELEHLCVDGGSRDGTREVIDRWAQRSTHLRRVYEPDDGIYDAMNNGMRVARGEYILFLNADDFLATRHSLAAALKGVSVGTCGAPDLIVGHVSMGRLGARGFWRHRRVPRLLGRLPGLFPVHQGQLIKRTHLLQLGGFDARLRLASDITLYYDLERRLRPTVRRVDEDLAFMRAGGAANAGFRAVVRGSLEMYRHLRPIRGVAMATVMVCVKSVQSLLELRYGVCPHARWFASELSN